MWGPTIISYRSGAMQINEWWRIINSFDFFSRAFAVITTFLRLLVLHLDIVYPIKDNGRKVINTTHQSARDEAPKSALLLMIY